MIQERVQLLFLLFRPQIDFGFRENGDLPLPVLFVRGVFHSLFFDFLAQFPRVGFAIRVLNQLSVLGSLQNVVELGLVEVVDELFWGGNAVHGCLFVLFEFLEGLLEGFHLLQGFKSTATKPQYEAFAIFVGQSKPLFWVREQCVHFTGEEKSRF